MLYAVVHFILKHMVFPWFRLECSGQENVPWQGGAIIAANHISLWDPPVIGTALRRPTFFMAKKELFAIPVLGWLIRQLNSFPVRRGMADRTAIRTAINVLKNGNILLIFPEGTRSKDGHLGAMESGVVMIAAKAGVPIIPTAVIGTNNFSPGGLKFFRLPQFKVVFGKPIFPEPDKLNKEYFNEVKDTMAANIKALL